MRISVNSVSRSVVSDSLQLHGLYPARLLYPWNSPVKNIGVGGCFLLQGIFLTQGSKPGLLHCKQILYQNFKITVTPCHNHLQYHRSG